MLIHTDFNKSIRQYKLVSVNNYILDISTYLIKNVVCYTGKISGVLELVMDEKNNNIIVSEAEILQKKEQKEDISKSVAILMADKIINILYIAS